MKNILTVAAIALVITSSTTVAGTGKSTAHPLPTKDSPDLKIIEDQSLIDQQKVSDSIAVPEPNGLVALAFAGIVILARHRFRP